jgi:hypothetical protein
MKAVSLVLLLLLLAAGCASDRWEVIEGLSATILLDRESGKTWSADFSHLPGEDMQSQQTQHWREMTRTAPATQPTGGE